MKHLEDTLPSGQDRIIAAQPKGHIPGWGMDADPENDPTYPMKHWNGADHERLNYEKAPQQQTDIEILRSIERPAITSVFGTSTPPSGLSGALRRWAFTFSEAKAGHWMGLLLADRVNVVEGVLQDLSKGHIPNIIKEKGWTAEWKYNRKGAVQKIAVAAGVAVAIGMLVYRKKAKK